ncbi:MAG: allA [Hyphomicrobiales bacterium]|nr:allA [Hyphomicrobiales bacterium]
MKLKVEPLTKVAFAPFGEVVEAAGAREIPINQGYAVRRNGLARVDVAHQGGDTQVCLFVAQPRPAPVAIEVMERHPDGSQLFYPLQDRDWLVVVCDDPKTPASYRAFLATGRQGVNYARNVWHHPLLVCDADSRFMVVDRAGPGANLEEVFLDKAQPLELDFDAASLNTPGAAR